VRSVSCAAHANRSRPLLIGHWSVPRNIAVSCKMIDVRRLTKLAQNI
jgi:hypothetical protein